MTDLNKLREKIEDWPNMFSDGKTNFIPVRDVLDLIDGAVEQIRTEFINKYPKNYANEPELGGRSCIFSLNEVLQIIDKHTGRKESK